MIGYLVATGATYKAVADAFLGGEPNWKRSLAYAFKRAHSLLWVTLLGGLLVLTGTVLFFIPGLYLGVAFAVVIPAVMTEDVRGRAALRRSRRLVKGRWWRTLTLLVLGAILSGVLFYAAVLMVPVVTGNAGPRTVVGVVVDALTSTVLSALTIPFAAAYVTVLYFDLRVRREAFDLQLLALEVGVDAASTGAMRATRRRRSSRPPQPWWARWVSAAARAETPAQVRSLAARAEHDPAALADLRRITVVGAQQVDFRALLDVSGDALDGRLHALAAQARRRAEPSGTRARARRILSERRFTGSSVPRPFNGVLGWLGDKLSFVGRLVAPSRTDRRREATRRLDHPVRRSSIGIAAAVATRIAQAPRGQSARPGTPGTPPAARGPAKLEREAPRQRSTAISSRRCGCASGRGCSASGEPIGCRSATR